MQSDWRWDLEELVDSYKAAHRALTLTAVYGKFDHLASRNDIDEWLSKVGFDFSPNRGQRNRKGFVGETPGLLMVVVSHATPGFSLSTLAKALGFKDARGASDESVTSSFSLSSKMDGKLIS